MGLFGRDFNWGRAAIGLFSPEAAGHLNARDAARAQSDEERRRRESLYNNLIKQGMDPGVAELVMTNPQAFGQEYSTRFRTREGAAGGGTVSTPNLNGTVDTRSLPSRHEVEGRIVDISPEGAASERYNGNQGRIRWQTGPWGAFATDEMGRPITPGTPIQSDYGQQPPGQTPGIGDGIPGNPPAASRFPMPSINQPQGLDADSIFGRMIQQESGGQQFGQNGRPLRSPKGATGIAQVMPATGPEAAALAGLPWDPQRFRNDAQYNYQLGRAYFQNLLQEFQDPALAAAAYNAGPQRVRNAVRRGGANWIAHVPQETRDYVRNTVGGMGGNAMTGGGAVTQNQGQSVQQQAAQGFVTAPQQAPQGYQWNGQGGLAPIPGGPGDPTANNQQAVGQVLNDFRQNPEVREFRNSRIATQQLLRLGQTGSPAADIAMVFNFMKTLDNTSAVREGEQATVRNAAGVPERIRNYYNMMLEGSTLTPQQRADLVRTGQGLYLERAESYNELVEGFRNQLRMYGVDEEQVSQFMPQALGPAYEERNRRNRQQSGQQQQQSVPGLRIVRRRRR